MHTYILLHLYKNVYRSTVVESKTPEQPKCPISGTKDKGTPVYSYTGILDCSMHQNLKTNQHLRERAAAGGGKSQNNVDVWFHFYKGRIAKVHNLCVGNTEVHSKSTLKSEGVINTIPNSLWGRKRIKWWRKHAVDFKGLVMFTGMIVVCFNYIILSTQLCRYSLHNKYML